MSSLSAVQCISGIFHHLDHVGVEVELLPEGGVQAHQLSSLSILTNKERLFSSDFIAHILDERWPLARILTSGMPITPLRATLFFFTAAVTSSRDLDWNGWNQNKKEQLGQPARASVHFRKVNLFEINLGIRNTESSIAEIYTSQAKELSENSSWGRSSRSTLASPSTYPSIV